MLDHFVHKTLRIPYKLTVAYDSGSGEPIILLHGIASNSTTWRNVTPLLPDNKRVVAFDLLGFGVSPKPDWATYNLDDHAKAVAATIKKLRLKRVTLVGHSMGSLIAVHVASQYPKLVKQLVLCSMPLYVNDDITNAVASYKKTDRHLSNAYFSVYQAIAERPELTLKGAQQIVKLAGNDTSFRLDESTWTSFKQSLKNSIENQTTLSELATLRIPITILYGQFDVFVISKYFKQLAKSHLNVTVIKVAGRHEITPQYAKKVAAVLTK